MELAVVKLFLLSGLFGGVNSIIDWAAAIGAAASAAGAVTSGASMLHSLAGAPGFSVVCTIEIENWTKYPLVYPESHINGGMMKSPPVAVKPGQKESFIVHKTGHTATGTYGTASWLISGENRRAVVMWSCPFNFNHYSNWLAVGITDSEYMAHKASWFNQMYYKSSGNGLNFVRGEYYYHTRTLSMKNGGFEITGIMGTSHKAKAHIIVRPLHESDLAPNIKARVKRDVKPLLNTDLAPSIKALLE